MFAAIILCSALLPAEPDALTVRVVNTLEEPVSVRFRIVGKEEWVKPDLSLDSAQTKNFALPKGDKYEVVIRDKHDKDLPVGSWDIAKILTKDAKAEIHIAETSQHLGKTVPKPVATKPGAPAGYPVATPYLAPSAAAPAASGPSIELCVFSQKQYYPIGEFINGKSEEKTPADPTPGPPPTPTPPGEPPRTIKPINRR